jgi:hypothetical protein
MPDNNTYIDWIKIIGPLLTGGLFGAILTAIITKRRNKIQPVGRRLRVSYIDLPKKLHSYSAMITLKDEKDGDTKSYHFQQLAIVQLDLVNKGNQDIEKFDVGISLPENFSVIGVDY